MAVRVIDQSCSLLSAPLVSAVARVGQLGVEKSRRLLRLLGLFGIVEGCIEYLALVYCAVFRIRGMSFGGTLELYEVDTRRFDRSVVCAVLHDVHYCSAKSSCQVSVQTLAHK